MAVDVVYVWGSMYEEATTSPVVTYASPALVVGLGTGGLPTPLGAIDQLDAENGWFTFLCADGPYAMGGNGEGSTSTVFYNVDQQAVLSVGTGPPPSPVPLCSSDGSSVFNWAGAGVTLPLLAIKGGNCCWWAIDSAGLVWAAGWNDEGKLGLGSAVAGNSIQTPTAVWSVGSPPGGPASGQLACVAVWGGGKRMIGLLTAGGEVVCCGDNTYGQCGDGATVGSTGPFSVPIKVVGTSGSGQLTGIAAISGSNDHCAVLTTTGLVLSWGYNAFGQLGNNTSGGGVSGSTANSSSVPVSPDWSAVSSPPWSGAAPVITQLFAGGGYQTDGQTFCIDNAGNLWGWGCNTSGQLGVGSSGNYFATPQLVSGPAFDGGPAVTQVSSGADHLMFLRADNSLWICGANASGQLGIPALGTGITDTPVQINGGIHATLPTSAIVNSIFAGNQTSVVDLSVTPVVVAPVVTQRGLMMAAGR